MGIGLDFGVEMGKTMGKMKNWHLPPSQFDGLLAAFEAWQPLDGFGHYNLEQTSGLPFYGGAASYSQEGDNA